MSFIQLNRTFREINLTSAEPSNNTHAVDKHLAYAPVLSWEDLLDKPRVFILAEAGAARL